MIPDWYEHRSVRRQWMPAVVGMETEDDLHLLEVLARQSSQALENFRLHRDLVQSVDNDVDMLAEIAEFKDRTTGGRINRIDRYTAAAARAMRVPEAEARRDGRASRLHDVGRIGIPDHVVDVFDALICHRPDKESWPIADVRRTIVEGAGVQFDPAVVDAFIHLLDRGEFDDALADLGERADERP